MNFQLAAIGHSFKGSMAYYLHDKRQEGAAEHPQTADRVAWTETRNLATDGAHTATRIMIATARQADELKAAAGIANTGRKATAGAVFAFSLAWHPDEAKGIDRAEMVKAADHALQVLGLDHLQAVLIAHQDTKHPHVHVVVNRVNPETGRMETIQRPKVIALDKWADRYERERGNIVSPNRARKYDEIDRRKRQNPDPEKRKAHIEEGKRRRAAEAEERRKATATTTTSTRPQSEAAILKDLTDAQRRDHKAQWVDLSARHAPAKDAIYSHFAARMKATAAQHKEDTRADWRQFFKDRDRATRERAKMEKTAFGLLSLSLIAAKEQMRRGEAPNRGLLALTFANVLSSHRREATFAAAHERDRLAFANRLKAQLDQKMQGMKAERGEALARQREAFGKERAALIAKQNAEREKIREAWRQIYSRRGMTPTQQAQTAPPTESADVKNHFNDKAEGLPPPPKAPTEQRFVSSPAPSPSPSGAPPIQARTVQDVPKKAEPSPKVASTPTPAKEWGKVAPPPSKPAPAKDWTQAAEPPKPSPAPVKDWNAKPDQPRDPKPLPTKSKDRERDR
jgi:hypothetical protein